MRVACILHGRAQPFFILGKEHQKASAPCANQLAAHGAVIHGKVVPFVNSGIAHATGAVALVLPMLVHEFAKSRNVALFQRLPAAVAQLLHTVKILKHGGVILL